jgi:hypothetical protein
MKVPRPAPIRPRLGAGLAVAAVVVAALAAAAPCRAADELATYHQLQEWRYQTAATPVPAGGVTFEREGATWTLESGTLRLTEPTAAGAVTGLVFEGQGRFHYSVSDPVERAQLARRSGGRSELDQPFSRLVLRAPGGVAELVGVAPPTGPYEKSDLAAKRQEDWLERRQFDADARILQALLTPGSDYLRVGMDTDDFGWLTWELDPERFEAVRIERYDNRFVETWVSVPRAQPPDHWGRAIKVTHVDVKADLTRAGRGPQVGYTHTQPRLGEFSVDLTAEAEVSGTRALPLVLTPWADVKAVRVNGKDAPFIRSAIGERSVGIDNDLQDDSLLVLLPEPLEKGGELTVGVDYEREIYNYVGGRSWYPAPRGDSLDDPHTGTFDLVLPDKIDARAMGERTGESKLDHGRHEVTYRDDDPSVMLSFTIAERAQDYVLESHTKNVPTVEVFGTGMGKIAKFHNVAADVHNSAAFFTELFDMPLDSDHLLVSSIVGGHGQAFKGFLHLSEGTFHLEQPGASELFRAHETAHEWWGHMVSWDSYRDQWLSEAFAEYSAMMYVEATMKDGEHWFHQILDVYSDELNGSIKTVLSKFARPGVVPLNPQQRAEMGPIGLGYRASSADVQSGYFAQTYEKGALVLHMLRTMLGNATKSDDLFVKVLRTFLHEYKGKSASTEDFIHTLGEVAPGHWQWFFDQWVYGTDIPTYAWDWKVEKGPGGKPVLALTVKQSGVHDGFRMPVPVRIDFGGDQHGTAVVLVDKPEETFHFPLPARPKDVTFDPDHAVLAKLKGL